MFRIQTRNGLELLKASRRHFLGSVASSSSYCAPLLGSYPSPRTLLLFRPIGHPPLLVCFCGRPLLCLCGRPLGCLPDDSPPPPPKADSPPPPPKADSPPPPPKAVAKNFSDKVAYSVAYATLGGMLLAIFVLVYQADKRSVILFFRSIKNRILEDDDNKFKSETVAKLDVLSSQILNLIKHQQQIKQQQQSSTYGVVSFLKRFFWGIFDQPEQDIPHAINVTPAEQEGIE